LEGASALVAGQQGDVKELASKAADLYRMEASAQGITAVIEVFYRHGLGIYSSQSDPAPIIVADVVVIRVSDGEILLSQTLYSDAYWKQGYSLPKLTKDNNRLYIQEITFADDAMGHLLAAELGVPLDLKEKSYWK